MSEPYNFSDIHTVITSALDDSCLNIISVPIFPCMVSGSLVQPWSLSEWDLPTIYENQTTDGWHTHIMGGGSRYTEKNKYGYQSALPLAIWEGKNKK